jgi:CheY-like chemotaxis protein
VADTGKGIKPEDQEKLFGEFVQVDTAKNRGIEGTGLGLAITRRLCQIMGGDISVKSKYGSGSSFTAIVPQGIESNTPFARVEEPEKKKVLVYEGRTVYAKSVCWSLHNMGVPHTIVTSKEDFTAAMRREEWYCIISGYSFYERIKPFMEQPPESFPGGKKPFLVLMMERETETYLPDVRFLSVPPQSLSIANILNGKAESNDIFDNSAGYSGVRFTFPGARLLVVDDIDTNLRVAEGLLEAYHARVDTSLNGFDAVELAKRYEYDIIFMDHMMPEMDGIEATTAIRSWENTTKQLRRVPIIALTANAVSGMREMFIEKGFSDFLAKPIDVSKMEEALVRWIPREKREAGNSEQKTESKEQKMEREALSIPGVDTQYGIAMTGGTVAAYKKVLAMFRKDAQNRLPILQTLPPPGDMTPFITQVHALKSALGSLGAAEISAKAARIEAAGKSGDIKYIQENLDNFAECLAELVINIGGAMEIDTAGETAAAVPVSSLPVAALDELEDALQSKNIAEVERILEKLMLREMDKKTMEALERVSDDILMAEFGSAITAIEELRSYGK